MPRTTDADLAWARSGKKPITLAIWTGGYRLVPSKQKGYDLIQTWRRWHQRKGWTVLGTQESYRAYPPEATVGVMAQASHGAVVTFHRDGDTWSTTRPKKSSLE